MGPLRGRAATTCSGREYAIPGLSGVGALIYAIFGTALTQWIGSPLVRLDFNQQRYEPSASAWCGYRKLEQIRAAAGKNAERARGSGTASITWSTTGTSRAGPNA